MANKSRQVAVRETASSDALSTVTPESSRRPLSTQEVIGRRIGRINHLFYGSGKYR